MNQFKSLFFLLLAGTVLTFTACENNDDDGDKITNVDFQINYVVDGQPFTYGDVYEINGTDVSFETAMFYIGGIELHPEEGSMISFADKYLLVDPVTGKYEVGEAEPGHYHEYKFYVGVDPVANSQTEDDFTTRSSDDPLAEQSPVMHWNWNSGYKFLRFDGMADIDGDGTPETGIAYHLGSDNMLKELEFTAHMDFETGDNTITFTLDVAKLFDGVDFQVEEDRDTHTGNNLPLAELIRDNLETALSN